MTAFKRDRPKISNLWNLLRDRLSHLSSNIGQTVKVSELEFKSALPEVSQDFPHRFCREAGVLLTLAAALFRRRVERPSAEIAAGTLTLRSDEQRHDGSQAISESC